MYKNIFVLAALLLAFCACKKDVSFTAAQVMAINCSRVNVNAVVGENIIAANLSAPGASGYKELQPGYTSFSVSIAGSLASLFTGNTYIGAGKSYSVFVVGNNTPVTHVVFDTLPALTDSALYRFFNFADDTLVTNVFINNFSDALIFSRSNDSSINATTTTFVPTTARTDTFKLRKPDGSFLLDTVFSLSASKAYTFYLSGSVTGSPMPLRLNRVSNN